LKQKVSKVATFRLWPEDERIENLKSNGWSSEKIKELLESEKIMEVWLNNSSIPF